MNFPHFDTMFDPADDYDPWIAIKVWADGNPVVLARFATEAEADAFLADVQDWEKVKAS